MMTIEKLRKYVKEREEMILECKVIARSPNAFAVGVAVSLTEQQSSRIEVLEARVRELEAENEALDRAHRHVLNQRNAAQDALVSSKRTTWAEQQALYDRDPLSHLNPAAEDWRRSEPPPYGLCILNAAEQKLADANALLEHVLKCSDPDEEIPFEAIQAHLAGQPAAPSRTEADQECCMGGRRTERWCGTQRSEDEQAVLDACAAVNESALTMATGMWGQIAVAELARRGLK